ncbi:hypothetical protein [Falsarthrobacter nasiphocae]|uniref:DNA modification methylase n=1 Tax=Falsarthrobacter nasiphocae TaxID=189863 RepID=A0AAE3YHA7_9MICC|nr:hypothetical protein [Falsarthrobacter nasiphocae]MDR6891766.1 hypothetical protein [Falsarthrobacter nasiphocae]
MTNLRAIRARRTAAAVILAASLAGATGCSAINEQATTKTYNPSDGVSASLHAPSSDVQMRNMLIVTNAKDKPGRLLGTLVNTGSSPVTVQFTVGSTKVAKPITVPAGAKNTVSLEDKGNEVEIASTPKTPGENVSVTATAGGKSAEFSAPVLDGTLEQYRAFIPGGYTPAPKETTAPSKSSGH